MLPMPARSHLLPSALIAIALFAGGCESLPEAGPTDDRPQPSTAQAPPPPVSPSATPNAQPDSKPVKPPAPIANPVPPGPTPPLAQETTRAETPTPAPANSPQPIDSTAAINPRLVDAVALYQRGEYNNAIRRLANREFLIEGNLTTQVLARKHLAFSYCVTRRPVPCKQQFDAILKLDPTFDLTPAEAGHPQWGPVFKRAKVEAERVGSKR